MDATVLDELVGVWEQWTAGDPLLRCMVQSRRGGGRSQHGLKERMLDCLERLAHATGHDPTFAAVSAGWAVLLALEAEHCARGKPWQRLYRDARDAHQDALAAAQHTQG